MLRFWVDSFARRGAAASPWGALDAWATTRRRAHVESTASVRSRCCHVDPRGRTAIEPLLARLTGVTAGYARMPVLHRLDLDLPRGRCLAVLGGSGVGKSTLLKILAGVIEPDSGTVEFAGGVRPRQAVALQDPLLYPWLTVEGNLHLAQRFGANRDHVDPRRVTELVDALGLRPVLASYPDEVSGGQAQRVSLGRALAVDPELLLLDEPLSALDPAIRSGLQRWLRERSHAARTTTVVVTHDIDEALVLADEVVLLGGGIVSHRWHNEGVDDPDRSDPRLRLEIRSAYDEPATWPDAGLEALHV